MKRVNMNKAQLFGDKDSFEIIMKYMGEKYYYSLHEVVTDYEEEPFINLIHLPEMARVKQALEELDLNKPLTDKSIILLFNRDIKGGWCSRGNPHLWQAISREFTDLDLPISVDEFESVYRKAYEKYTGIDFDDPEDSFYMKEFAHGGMSSGIITRTFFIEELERLKKEIKKLNHLS